MSTRYGMPLILEDKTGKLSGSEFIDIHDRLHLVYRCTSRSSTHATYMIFHGNSTSNSLMALNYGPKNALGTISFSPTSTVPMQKYLLSTSSPSGKAWLFTASDGQEYFWRWRSQANQEWTCTNSSGHCVASYSLKTPGEPHYDTSSGCCLTIEEAFPHIATEILGTLMVMRHMVEHKL